MIHSKKKGNSFELHCIKLFKELTCEQDIQSARNSNRSLDNEGVDFETKEFYIQCKAKETSINTHDIISNMKDGKTKFLLHKRNRKGIVVSMDYNTFKTLLTGYITYTP